MLVIRFASLVTWTVPGILMLYRYAVVVFGLTFYTCSFYLFFFNFSTLACGVLISDRESKMKQTSSRLLISYPLFNKIREHL